MWSIRQAFSLKGSIWPLLQGNLGAIKLSSPQTLEDIVINLLLMVPLGYLMPITLDTCGEETTAWQVILSGSAISAAIELIQYLIHPGMLDVDDWLHGFKSRYIIDMGR